MNPRLTNILQKLYEQQRPVTSSFLAAKLQVSAKTIRNDIKELKELLPEDAAKVNSKRGIGYRLVINNEETFYQFLKKYDKAVNQGIPADQSERVHYIIEKLLLESNYLKIEDLMSELFISRATIQKDIHEARKILQKNHLSLVQKPNYGIKIVGDEIDIRLCMSQFAVNQQNSLIAYINENWLKICSKDETRTIANILLDVFKKMGVSTSDIGLQKLIIHTIIACKRIHSGNIVKLDESDLKRLINTKEYKIAYETARDAEKYFSIKIPECEIAYMTMHLQGTKLLDINAQKANEKKFIFNPRVFEIAKEMLRGIDQHYHLYLQNDPDLIMSLCMHLESAINRLKYRMKLKNPLLDQIKTNYPQAFDAALIGAIAVKDRYNIIFDEHEIGYIALHLEWARERQKKEGTRVPRCLLVCTFGLSTAKLLSYKLKNRFGGELDIVGITSYHNLNNQLLKNVDFIISTTTIDEDIPVPVVYINTILGDLDFKRIEKFIKDEFFVIEKYLRKEYTFLQMNFESQKEVFQFLGKRLLTDGLVDKDYIESLMERERYSPTSFGNLVAIPHPIKPHTLDTFWAIVTLTEPIQWGDQPVQFICLLNIGIDNETNLGAMYSALVKLLGDPAIIQKLLQCKTYSEMKHIFMELQAKI